MSASGIGDDLPSCLRCQRAPQEDSYWTLEAWRFSSAVSAWALASWAGRIVLRDPRVTGLNHEVPAVPIQAGAVDHVLTIGVEAIPLAVEPVFEVTDEEVLVAHAEEAAIYALAILETGVDGVQQFPLPILLAEDVFMGPSVPVGDRLPPGGAGNELRQFHTLPFHRRLRCPFWRDGKQARPTGLERLSTQKINEVPTCHVQIRVKAPALVLYQYTPRSRLVLLHPEDVD